MVDRASVEIRAYFRAVVSCVWGRESVPFVVGGKVFLRCAVGIGVGAKCCYAAEPRFLYKYDVKGVVISLKHVVRVSVVSVDIDRLNSDGLFRH